jgi:hypothetical protein
MFDLFNSDLVRQRETDYRDTLMRTMRAARGSTGRVAGQPGVAAAVSHEPRQGGQPMSRRAAADCG